MAGWIDPEEREEARRALGLEDDDSLELSEPQANEEQPQDNPFSFLDGFAGLAKAQQGLNGNTASPLMGGALPPDYGDPLRIMQQEADEQKARQTQELNNMQGIIDEMNAQDRQRAEALKPKYTQEELDRRRAAGTMLTTLTSALANLANGINVSKGGLNATVPDGYSVAYQHWNDIQKQQDQRRREYDKIIDSVNQRRLSWAQTQYGIESKEYQTLLAQIENEKNRRNKLAQTNAEVAGRIQIARDNNESRERTAAITAQGGIDKAKVEGKYRVSVEKEKTNREKVKAENRGVDLEDYRTYSGTNGTIAIPDDMDVEDGYLAMANAALNYLDTIQDTKENKTELANKKKALREALTGSNKDKVAKLKKLSTAIANSGVSQEELEAALNVTHQENGGTESDDPNAIFG